MDVFRLLPGDSALSLGWLKDEDKTKLTQWLKASGPPGPDPAPVAGDGTGGSGAAGPVESGLAGVRGLAKALGSGAPAAPGGDEVTEVPVTKTKKKKKRKVDEEKEPTRERFGEALQEEVAGRKAPRQGASALRLGSKKSRKEKKKRKKREKEDGDSSTDSSGSDESLFQLAALPTGTEKIHRLHEEKPGALANLTLLKFQEILERTVGLGRRTARGDEAESLPPVCRGYLTQILLTRYPEEVMGVRNLWELRTLAQIVDSICQNNAIRSVDVALQRFKSIEMFMAQGSWEQGNLLELIPSEGEARSFFRPELKAPAADPSLPIVNMILAPGIIREACLIDWSVL